MAKLTTIIPVLVVLFAITVVYFPHFTWNILITIDFFTPWNIWESDIANSYHQFLVNRLPEIPEESVPEIHISEATVDKIYELTNQFKDALVVRGGTSECEAVKKWSNKTFWVENYGHETVMCGQTNTEKPPTLITVAEAMDSKDPWYIAGEVALFAKHPELFEMLKDPNWDGDKSLIKNGKYYFPNMFIGRPGMGSDVHTAIALNVFRMVAGSKKWWLIDNNQMPYLFGQQNPQGFSAITKTTIGTDLTPLAPWLGKIKRRTTVLHPGDVLINTAWLWHGIKNVVEEDPNELTIGVATRFAVGIWHSVWNNPVQTGMFALASRNIESNDDFQDALLKGRQNSDSENDVDDLLENDAQ